MSKWSSGSITLLEKECYALWSCKVKAALLVAKLWDLVSGTRVKPVIPAAIGNASSTAIVNQLSVERATAALDSSNDAYNVAASLIINTI